MMVHASAITVRPAEAGGSLGANPFLGVVFHWLGGLASASCYLPFRGIKRWSWETYWLLQGIFSWIIAPLVLAGLLVPNLFPILHASPSSSIFFAYFWGCLWGIGGLTCGLSIRYLGFALGYPIVLGLCTVFGTLMPPIFSGEIRSIASQASGQVILLGIGVCVLGIFFSGFAGRAKENELTEAQKKESVEEFHYGKGIAVSILSGIMSACFAYGLAAGKPIGDIARGQLFAHHDADLWQNLPVLVVVLWGGFTTNFIWCLILLVRNRSASQLAGDAAEPEANHAEVTPLDAALADAIPLADAALIDDLPRQPIRHERLKAALMFTNYSMAALAGVMWYFQFFFYSMGQTKMGKYDFSSWTLHMASIIIFATIWGFALKEWRGTSLRARSLVAVGLALLVASTVVVGYGNYIKASQTSGQSAMTQPR
jgi:L-rhamnose-H+ transport protein